MKPGSYRVAVVVDSWYRDSPQQCWLISWWVCWRRWGKCSRRHKIETFESFEPSPWTWSPLHVTRIPGDSLTDDWQGAGLCNGFHSRNQPTLLALGISLSMMVTMVMMIRATNRTRCHTHHEAIFQCRDLVIDSSHPVVVDCIQISKTQQGNLQIQLMQHIKVCRSTRWSLAVGGNDQLCVEMANYVWKWSTMCGNGWHRNWSEVWSKVDWPPTCQRGWNPNCHFSFWTNFKRI